MSSVKYDLPERVEGDLIRFAKKYDKQGTAVKEILAAVFLCCGNYGDAEVF